MVKKQLFYLYIFCSLTLLVYGEKNIFPNLTKSQEPEPLEKNSKIRSRLGKKSGAGAA